MRNLVTLLVEWATEERFQSINTTIEELKMQMQELATALTEVRDQMAKVKSELDGKITALEDAIVDAQNVPDEVVALVADVRTSLDALDAIVPDAV